MIKSVAPNATNINERSMKWSLAVSFSRVVLGIPSQAPGMPRGAERFPGEVPRAAQGIPREVGFPDVWGTVLVSFFCNVLRYSGPRVMCPKLWLGPELFQARHLVK